jgi:4-hydroxy-3-methylbut-2-enyl diphosphate reductase IspH
VRPPQTERLAYVRRTTPFVDETTRIVEVLRARFPGIDALRRRRSATRRRTAGAP